MHMSIEFKNLEIKHDKSWLRRTLTSSHAKKTIRYILIGAIAGFLFFYISEGRQQNNILISEIIRSMAIGGFFGFFISNSPCARGKC